MPDELDPDEGAGDDVVGAGAAEDVLVDDVVAAAAGVGVLVDDVVAAAAAVGVLVDDVAELELEPQPATTSEPTMRAPAASRRIDLPVVSSFIIQSFRHYKVNPISN